MPTEAEQRGSPADAAERCRESERAPSRRGTPRLPAPGLITSAREDAASVPREAEERSNDYTNLSSITNPLHKRRRTFPTGLDSTPTRSAAPLPRATPLQRDPRCCRPPTPHARSRCSEHPTTARSASRARPGATPPSAWLKPTTRFASRRRRRVTAARGLLSPALQLSLGFYFFFNCCVQHSKNAA